MNAAVAGLDLFGDVPGDGLALAIRVGGQKDLGGSFGRSLDLGDDLLLRVDDHVGRPEIVLEVDADGRLGQILDVTHRSLHLETMAQVFLDRAGLGRRFDDDQGAAAFARRGPFLLRGASACSASGGLGRDFRVDLLFPSRHFCSPRRCRRLCARRSHRAPPR